MGARGGGWWEYEGVKMYIGEYGVGMHAVVVVVPARVFYQ